MPLDAERISHVVDGMNSNELTDVNDCDPFTGVPHDRYMPSEARRARRG
jgi:hypothetical protein